MSLLFRGGFGCGSGFSNLATYGVGYLVTSCY